MNKLLEIPSEPETVKILHGATAVFSAFFEIQRLTSGGSISEMNRLPAAVFVVDILREKIAIQEALKLNIKTFAMVDTNSNPDLVDFPIPSNDDASKSIDIILSYVFDAIEEGLDEREKELKAQKDQAAKKELKNSDNNDSKKDEEKTLSESKNK